MNLKNKNIIVTGGGRGIGAGICKQLASAGAQLAITYTSRPDAAEGLLKTLEGSGHHLFKMDISNEDSVNQGFSEIFSKFESIHGLVNNAGITKDQLLLRMKAEDFDSVIQTNLRGVFLCTKAIMKPMVKARMGSIVNITSVIGHSGNAGQANYAASKAGIDGFTKSTALEIGSRGIRVNAVAPGFITTDMTHTLTEDQKNTILARIPLQKFGTPEDVANAVRFLLSDESTYITGQTIHVNGGMYM
jgi:3-oxoacyl-[acyl-carrier protein] reductase